MHKLDATRIAPECRVAYYILFILRVFMGNGAPYFSRSVEEAHPTGPLSFVANPNIHKGHHGRDAYADV